MQFCQFVFVFLISGFVFAAAEGEVVLHQDFEKAAAGQEAGKLDFLVIGEGEFKVIEDAGNKSLELTPTPLETYGLLVGPTELENISVRARVFGTKTGRRFPVFAVGTNGVGGYMLRLNPAKKALELLKGEDVKGTAPLEWTSGAWYTIELVIVKTSDKWKLSGKAWESSKEEPAAAMISFEESEKPLAGRASIWGIPYSTTPIRFDDLKVTKLK